MAKDFCGNLSASRPPVEDRRGPVLQTKGAQETALVLFWDVVECAERQQLSCALAE